MSSALGQADRRQACLYFDYGRRSGLGRQLRQSKLDCHGAHDSRRNDPVIVRGHAEYDEIDAESV